MKRVLGVTEVQPDGSAFFKVPARKPLYFQALDENGRVVQEFICPARAIPITPGAVKEGDWDKVEKAPKEFEIDMLRCIYCGMCEEACPEQAIFMSQDYLLTPTDRTQSIHNKARLYELGGTRKGLVNKWNQYK